MRIVITGAAGFLGTHAVAQALAAGHKVVAVDATRPEVPGAEFIHANLLDREAVRTVIAGADAVIHLGNHSHAKRVDAQTVLAENTAMNANVFYAAAEHAARRIVFASSIQAMSGGPLLPDHRYPPPPERRLPALVDEVRRLGVKAVFAEDSASSRLIQTLAAETGVIGPPALYADGPGAPGSGVETYEAMYRHNLGTILGALRAR